MRWTFQVGGTRCSVDHGPIQFGGRWHQVAGRRISSSRGPFGVEGVNRVFRPQMQRSHDEHQIQTRRWRFARSKVSSLEAALAALENHRGPEVDALRSASSKAKQAAQERPLKAQLAHTDAFIGRSRFRIQKLDQEREAETELLNSALQRQARLREQIAEPEAVAHPAPSDSGDELARLRAKVAQLEASHSTSHPARGSVEAAEAARTRAGKRREGGLVATTMQFPTTHKSWTSGLGQRCWSCGTQTT